MGLCNIFRNSAALTKTILKIPYKVLQGTKNFERSPICTLERSMHISEKGKILATFHVQIIKPLHYFNKINRTKFFQKEHLTLSK